MSAQLKSRNKSTSIKSKKTETKQNLYSDKNTLTKLTNQPIKIESNPAAIFTDAAEIREKLKNYERVESEKVKDIPLGTRIKYVEVLPDGKYKYKPGGSVIINMAPEYLFLAGNRKSWSVQLKTHIIFIEHFEHIRKEYEQKIKELANNLEHQKEVSANLSNENANIKKYNGDLVNLLKKHKINIKEIQIKK